MRWRVQLGINTLIVRVMFGNLAKIGRAAGASLRKDVKPITTVYLHACSPGNEIFKQDGL
jgi:hypothetical protein